MKLLMLGCGNMGSAMLRAWMPSLNADNTEIWVLRASQNIQNHPLAGSFRFFASFPELKNAFDQNPLHFDLIVLGMKPQVIHQEIQNCLYYAKHSPKYNSKHNPKHSLCLTIAAGLPSSWYLKHQAELRLVRIMPNLGARVGMSASLAFAANKLSADEKKLLEFLLKEMGEFLWCEQEELLDQATPVSGSGPAYFYLICEILQNELEKMGFAKNDAQLLAETTLIGAAEYIKHTEPCPDKAARLRREVTSKAGVTEAALEVLQETLPNTFAEAIQRGIQRNRELQQQ